MNSQAKVEIGKLPTGVPGLDTILGGGLSEFSFNLIAGTPGCGKTTLAHQIVFANATPERPALYFTVLGEPALKMLRFQQQFDFFDFNKLNPQTIRFINLSHIAKEGDFDAILAEIVRNVEEFNPGIVVVDSFRTVMRQVSGSGSAEVHLQAFAQQLALTLTTWEVTSFLVGEYSDAEIQDNPIFTIADGIWWLSQEVERNSVVRKLRIMKTRGQEQVPGLHTFRITNQGIRVFARNLGLVQPQQTRKSSDRLSMGNSQLDTIMEGGIPVADSLLITGPSGSGKSIFALHFVAEQLRQGRGGIVAVFEEHPQEFFNRANRFHLDMEQFQKEGMLHLLYIRPLDVSLDEMLNNLLDAVEEADAKWVVIDSLDGLQMVLVSALRPDFRESLYRLMGMLRSRGVTVISTAQVMESFTDLILSDYDLSFLCDSILRLRYVEIEAEIRRVLMIGKMRGTNYDHAIREFVITTEGIQIGEPLRDYIGLTTGVPRRVTNPFPDQTL